MKAKESFVKIYEVAKEIVEKEINALPSFKTYLNELIELMDKSINSFTEEQYDRFFNEKGKLMINHFPSMDLATILMELTIMSVIDGLPVITLMDNTLKFQIKNQKVKLFFIYINEE